MTTEQHTTEREEAQGLRSQEPRAASCGPDWAPLLGLCDSLEPPRGLLEVEVEAIKTKKEGRCPIEKAHISSRVYTVWVFVAWRADGGISRVWYSLVLQDIAECNRKADGHPLLYLSLNNKNHSFLLPKPYQRWQLKCQRKALYVNIYNWLVFLMCVTTENIIFLAFITHGGV